MYRKNLFSIKYTRRYSYAKFGTFFGPPDISVFSCDFNCTFHWPSAVVTYS